MRPGQNRVRPFRQLGTDAIAGMQDTLDDDTSDITGNADEGVAVANGASGDAAVLGGDIPPRR